MICHVNVVGVNSVAYSVAYSVFYNNVAYSMAYSMAYSVPYNVYRLNQLLTSVYSTFGCRQLLSLSPFNFDNEAAHALALKMGKQLSQRY